MDSHLPIARHQGHHHGPGHHHLHHGGGHQAETTPVLVELRRGGLTESQHRGALVLAEASGRRIGGLGHPATPTFLRSTAKPLQALPIITSGAATRFGLTAPELASMCGSLNGEDFQVAAVVSIMNKAGLSPDLLACGIHPPSHRPTAKALQARGEKPTPLHNNCAGKHAAMLVLCAHHGLDPHNYFSPTHPVQRLILDSVSALCAYPAEQIGMGVDGCGVPVYRLPLIALAGAYARLADPLRAGLPALLAEAVKTLMDACLAHPEMIAGTDRICTRLMQAAPGQLLAKTGAEGSYALALPARGLGIALNIEDGNPRAYGPVLCSLLHQLGVLDHEALHGPLADLAQPSLKNHRGDPVAELGAVFRLG